MSFSVKINGNVIPANKDFTFATGKNSTPTTFSFSVLENQRIPIAIKNNDDVEFLDDTKVLFKGNIVKITRTFKSKDIQLIQFECIDCSWEINKGELIAEVYEKKTANFIINDIWTRYPQLSNFTINNVDCDIEIDYFFIDHLRFFQVLNDLSLRTGYVFFVDNDRDVHFKGIGSDVSPIVIEEENGTLIKESLRYSEDYSKIVNNIVVEGATYDASDITTEPNKVADGVQTSFHIDEAYSGIIVTVGGVSKSVGANGIDNPANYDCLYDFPGHKVNFRDDNKPLVGQVVSVSGYEKLPIIVGNTDMGSVEDNGIMGKKILDFSLKTIASAQQYSLIALQKYSNELVNGSFKTHQKGLRAGQKIHISHNLGGFSGDYYIQNTSSSYHSDSKLMTTVQYASAESIDASSLLVILLNSQNRTITNKQILNALLSVFEKVGVSDDFTINEDVFDFEEEASVSDDFLVITNEVGRVPVHAGYEPTGLNDPKFPMLHNGSKAHI